MDFSFILTGLCAILIILVFFLLLYSKIDLTQYFNKIKDFSISLINDKKRGLLNANTLYNLPYINLNTTDKEINSLASCRDQAIYLGAIDDTTDYLNTCYLKCGGSGKLLTVTEDEEIYYNNKQLSAGVYCTTILPNCNKNTTYAVATVNGIKCVSKYPKLFGGELGSTIIACKNDKSSAILWDYKHNEAVNPETIIMESEDEKLTNGDYRFRCKINENNLDIYGNKLIEHPYNRLYITEDQCLKYVQRASFDAQTKFKKTNEFVTDYECNCGDYNKTRLLNEKPNDKHSICVPFTTTKNKIKQDCYTMTSPASMVSSCIPCNPDKFIDGGINMQEITLNYTTTLPYGMSLQKQEDRLIRD